MQFKIGDRVKVMPPSDQIGVDTIKRFKDKVTIIKGTHFYAKGKSTLGRTYTLYGCKSSWGIDLEFCEEWLVPMDEEVAE